MLSNASFREYCDVIRRDYYTILKDTSDNYTLIYIENDKYNCIDNIKYFVEVEDDIVVFTYYTGRARNWCTEMYSSSLKTTEVCFWGEMVAAKGHRYDDVIYILFVDDHGYVYLLDEAGTDIFDRGIPLNGDISITDKGIVIMGDKKLYDLNKDEFIEGNASESLNLVSLKDYILEQLKLS